VSGWSSRRAREEGQREAFCEWFGVLVRGVEEGWGEVDERLRCSLA